jgi:hypothetical protein
MTSPAMTRVDAPPRSSEQHDDAVRRLDAALAEQDRRHDQHEAARGTPRELNAYGGLCEANEQVAARDCWLNWLDENDY